MWKRNSGDESHRLQNQFTAYLITAIRRCKATYLQRKASQIQHELPFEEQFVLQQMPTEVDFILGLALLQQLENERLHHAILRLSERNRYIFVSRVLDDKSFAEIAAELGMTYGAAAMAYHRAIAQLRKTMGGETE